MRLTLLSSGLLCCLERTEPSLPMPCEPERWHTQQVVLKRETSFSSLGCPPTHSDPVDSPVPLLHTPQGGVGLSSPRTFPPPTTTLQKPLQGHVQHTSSTLPRTALCWALCPPRTPAFSPSSHPSFRKVFSGPLADILLLHLLLLPVLIHPNGLTLPKFTSNANSAQASDLQVPLCAHTSHVGPSPH